MDFVKGLREQRKVYAAQQAKGERFAVPREQEKPVNVILYRPAQTNASTQLPMLFNMHGGAWIGGDAMLMESFCQLMADSIPAMVVNVNYTKADEEPILYAMREVADAVCYFRDHAADYGIDPAKMAVGGHSAGAHLAAGTALLLKDRNVQLACQMLVYPCTDMVPNSDDPDDLIAQLVSRFFPNGGNEHPYLSPLRASDEQLKGLCPAIFIECGEDELRAMGIGYAKRLIDNAVPVKVREYPNALHGFLEVNRPDYPAGDSRQTPEQAAYCAHCEQYLIRELRACFDGADNGKE